MAPRATVIIPTFGNARFARWAINSVRSQTVKDIEICIVCDGSPEDMVAFFKAMEKEDHRIKVFTYLKSPRTGEPHRDNVIKQTAGKIVCYCCHDDLWLPDHIREIERTLKTSWFTHSIAVAVDNSLPAGVNLDDPISAHVVWINLKNRGITNTILNSKHRRNFFGLTFAAHTRESYFKINEGWVTTPEDVYTDLYMWRKFLSAHRDQCMTTPMVTALHFKKEPRLKWSYQERDEELRLYFERIQDPEFLRLMNEIDGGKRPYSELHQLKKLGLSLPQRTIQLFRDQVANATTRRLRFLR